MRASTDRCPRAARTPARQVAGFTLLELLVVIGIFAVFAAMAYGGLISVLQTRASLEAHLDRTAAYQKAYWILRDDFQNGINRPVQGNDGQIGYALQYIPAHDEVDFTRGGWANPLNLPRSTLRRLGYYLDRDEQALVRRTWPVLDRVPATQHTDTVLLSGVTAVRWRFLDDTGRWNESWPGPQANMQAIAAQASVNGGQPANPLAFSPPPPRAVEIVLDTKDWGSLRFLFPYGLAQAAGRNHGPSWYAGANVPTTPQQPGMYHGDPLHPVMPLPPHLPRVPQTPPPGTP